MAMDSLVEEGEILKNLTDELKAKLCSAKSEEAAAALLKGADRGWLEEGCAASAEAGSRYGSNDSCVYLDVACNHELTDHKCPVCGTSLYLEYGYPAPGAPLNHCKCNNFG